MSDGQKLVNGIAARVVALMAFAAVVGAALFWLASFLYRHIDITVRWT